MLLQGSSVNGKARLWAGGTAPGTPRMLFGEYGSGTVHGEDRDIQELLAAIEAAFVARAEDPQEIGS